MAKILRLPTLLLSTLLTSWLLLSSEVNAGSLDSIGAGEAMARGNAGILLETPFSPFYNPGSINEKTRIFEFNILYIYPSLKWNMGEMNGWSGDSLLINFGIVQNLLPLKPGLLNIGIAGALPADTLSVYRWSRDYPTTSPYILGFGEEMNRLDLHAGLSLKPFPFISMGAGISFFPHYEADSQIVITENEKVVWKSARKRARDLIVSPHLSPSAGILFNWRSLRGGAVYRAESFAQEEMEEEVEISNGECGVSDMVYSIFPHYYSPDTTIIGAGWEDNDKAFSFEISVKNWHKLKSFIPEGEFRDTFSFRFGGGFDSLNSRIMGGYRYEGSPVYGLNGEPYIIGSPFHGITGGFSKRIRYGTRYTFLFESSLLIAILTGREVIDSASQESISLNGYIISLMIGGRFMKSEDGI